ncbi:MAG TPA: phosphoribosylanthranilate isomerase [Elusimicrobia bacterium]|jgi:phosphoribosylanthranilate isomerase|nr:phosphoribosylanthranilate isomerase [Elusimicrobiota bacterium]
MIKIKICGITNDKDALWATNLGADYLGFNFYRESPRKISPELAKKIIAKLPPFVSAVGVFVNEEMKTVLKIVKKCNLSLVQLHGEEMPEYCEQLRSQMPDPRCRIIKAFRVKEEKSLEVIPQYLEKVDYFLLDTYVEGVEGGTGVPMSRDNWDLAVKVKEYGKPIFLAGGLSAENVQEAIRKVQPYAVDVASGVERLPRRKDYEKMKNFIQAVKSVRIG